MKLLYWNARGIANDDTQRALLDMVRIHRPLFVCLSEPFILLESINRSFWRSLGLVPITTNNRGLQAPNLWVLGQEALQPTVISSTDQQITFSCSLDGLLCVITAVYARTTIVGRRMLWQDLSMINTSQVYGRPWVVFGDFNCILGAHEKRGGGSPNLTSCMDFQQMCTVCGLIDIPTKGLAYTWSNRRIDEKLDRALGNLEWLEAWQVMECSTLAKSTSDHCPILLSFQRFALPCHSPFRFQNMWLQHPNFLQLIREFWTTLEFHGCPMFILSSKLRALKLMLKNWNKVHFGNIHTRVEATRQALDGVQSEICNLGPSDERFSREDDAHALFQVELSLQHTMLRDKSRVRWLKDGDRNTAFLHNLVRICRSNKSITSLFDGSAILQDHDSIASYIVQHYTNMFTRDQGIIDTSLVERTIPHVVTGADNEILTAILTHMRRLC
ncbi:uncharacterized protein LOC133711805 [Rosa rugosa]|uniref:uncharacterized protein LOC133711805 n=1 Tax=Rosa rugosa TaxID=74645 RepID=UPI002B40AFC9|nr:uncharacterized protein LOC133711805 [Rosa rugosa]